MPSQHWHPNSQLDRFPPSPLHPLLALSRCAEPESLKKHHFEKACGQATCNREGGRTPRSSLIRSHAHPGSHNRRATCHLVLSQKSCIAGLSASWFAVCWAHVVQFWLSMPQLRREHTDLITRFTCLEHARPPRWLNTLGASQCFVSPAQSTAVWLCCECWQRPLYLPCRVKSAAVARCPGAKPTAAGR
jgi:hypothetical protein